MPTERRRPIVPGSLEDRILDACATPQPMARVIEAGLARAADVKAAVRALIDSGRLQKLGGERGRTVRYQVK